jgi:hypothetical protein
MLRIDVAEATPIVQQAMKDLLLTISERGRPGSDARSAVGALLADLDALLKNDTLGDPLTDCFDLARKAGMTVPGVVTIYDGVVVAAPNTLGGKLVKNALIFLCGSIGARIIADMSFTSREDVEATKAQVNSAFNVAAEIAADAMDSAGYLATVRLHAATTHFLVETARPLPRMLMFRFAAPLTTLVAAHRLYDDAGRADELREENKVVHPAFMRHSGRALSA